MMLYNDLLRHTRALFYGVLPYPELLDVLAESGRGRWEKSTGRTGRMVPERRRAKPQRESVPRFKDRGFPFGLIDWLLRGTRPMMLGCRDQIDLVLGGQNCPVAE
jgi:hypothetical protein